MKKLLLIAVAATFVFSTAYAQDGDNGAKGISFGVKAGLNFASLTGDDAKELDLEGRTSLQAGGVVNIPVSEIFAVQPEVLFSGQGFTVEEDGIKGTGMLDYINVPILADFTVAEGFSLQAGPQIGFVVKDELEVEGETESLDAESTDFSAVFGAQYRTPIGLFFQARYGVGLSNVATEDGIDVKNGVFSVVAGWFFD